MVDEEYYNALAEVADILKHIKKEERDMVPNSFIEFIEENKSKTYKVDLDYTQEISNMKLNKKTKALLSYMYIKYWANEDEKNEFINKAKENDIKFEKEQREKYDIDKIFNSRKNNVDLNEDINKIQKLPIEVKSKNFIQRILEKIKRLFI